MNVIPQVGVVDVRDGHSDDLLVLDVDPVGFLLAFQGLAPIRRAVGMIIKQAIKWMQSIWQAPSRGAIERPAMR